MLARASSLVALLVATLVVAWPGASPAGAAGAQTAPAGTSLDLKVLIISVGDRATDNGLELMARTLDNHGVPYDVLDSSTATLTDAFLRTGQRGHYNGIILTQADLFTPAGNAMTPAEWQTLHTYERDFGVREAVIAGFPTTDPSHHLDYGMGEVGFQVGATGRWQSPAGTGHLFSYVNTATKLPIPEFSFYGVPRTGGNGPEVTPLLVDDTNPSRVLVSRLVYADGRQVMLSTAGNAWYRLHSNVLAYQLLDFATKGLFIGGRYMTLSTHTDDMFLADELWDPVANATDLNQSYRLTPADMDNVVAQQAAIRTAHPLAAGWRIQFPFNGSGATGWTANAPVAKPVGSDTTLTWLGMTNSGGRTTVGVSKSLLSEDRALLQATDIAAPAAPPADRIDKVTLRLTTTSSSALSVEACPLSQSWTEGSGQGGLLDLAPANWFQRQGTTSWQTQGGTIVAGACLPLQITAGAGAKELDITPIWQAWANGTRPNNGLVVRALANGSATFASSEATTAANRPSLAFATSAQPEPLTAKAIETRDQFGWINHTYEALQMDRLCPDPDEPQPGLCPVTPYATAHDEIDRNRAVWQALGLPGYQDGLPYLLSDSHSGLQDRRGTEDDISDDIPFPQGANPQFFQAAQDLGVKYVAGDASRINQDREQRIPGFDLVLLPRYPTQVYVNATTPAQNVDEYNWLYHERFVAQGQDPCTVPGAVCNPLTYEQLLASEADTTVNHMLSGNGFAHYFHQSNLRDYGGGRTLQTDWMDAVLDRYEQLFTLPVRTPQAHELGPDATDRIVSREQDVRGWIDLSTGVVTLQANGTANPLVTGLTAGTTYGGQRIGKVTVGATPQTFAVDPTAAS
jgi:hypothetical protein